MMKMIKEGRVMRKVRIKLMIKRSVCRWRLIILLNSHNRKTVRRLRGIPMMLMILIDRLLSTRCPR